MNPDTPHETADNDRRAGANGAFSADAASALDPPPHDHESERRLLGAVLGDRAMIAHVVDVLGPEHFTDRLLARVWVAIAAIAADGRDPSPERITGTFADELARLGLLPDVFLRLARASAEAFPERVKALAKTLVDLHHRRQMVAAAREMAEAAPKLEAAARDEAVPLADVRAACDAMLAPVRDAVMTDPARPKPALISVADVVQRSPPQMLIADLIPREGLVVLAGAPGSGKSFLALSAAHAIARGDQWFGRRVRPASVLYVVLEGAAGLTLREQAYQVDAGDGDDGALRFYAERLALADPLSLAAFAATVDAWQPPALIIFDTLSRLMAGLDENGPKDMGQAVDQADQWRARWGCAVALLHHTGKDVAKGSRGHSSLLGAADVEAIVERGDGGPRTLRVSKAKDSTDGPLLNFTLEPIDLGFDDHGASLSSCVVRRSDEVVKPAKKLTPLEKRAMDVLRNVLILHGEGVKGSVTFPSVTLVKIKRFREALKSAGVTDRDTPANERTQWRRLTTSLANKEVFVMSEDFCWAP